jgi:acetylornithine deacetylase/succinyl-diaminopimelate desuccinylase-like protein
VIVAHKGFVWAELEVDGVAAHGSRPDLGVDAIVKAGPVLTALGELDEALGQRTHHRCSAAARSTPRRSRAGSSCRVIRRAA